MEKKYIFENGVMKLNPKYQKEQGEKPSTVAEPDKALAIVSTPEDVAAASAVKMSVSHEPLQLSEATTASMEILQDEEFLQKFESKKPIDGGELLDGLTKYFAKYEVPIGMINKLLVLSEYKLNFIIDDSGSMSLSTDLTKADAHPEMQKKLQGTATRWQEAEDRLHVMMDILAYIPTNEITISFLNRNDKVALNHKGLTTEEFSAKAHAEVSKVFVHGPSGGTPVYGRLQEAFNNSTQSTMHYLFTDGVPSDASPEQVQQLVMNRSNPQMSPLTFVSCTSNDEEAKWMKTIEEDAPYTSEVDDFKAERAEVLHDQGPTFPFSKGFWLLCLMAAAVNPHDLDALDESVPFTRMTMDNLMGRKLSDEEYKKYFDGNPNSKKYASVYNEFMSEQAVAQQIIDKHPELTAKSGSKAFLGMFGANKNHQNQQQYGAPPAYRP